MQTRRIDGIPTLPEPVPILLLLRSPTIQEGNLFHEFPRLWSARFAGIRPLSTNAFEIPVCSRSPAASELSSS